VVYAGVVGAEMGTPDVGKRLLVEDIEVRDGEGKGATRGRERDGCQFNVLYLYEKEKEREQVHQGVRICLFRTRPDAITWRKVPLLRHCFVDSPAISNE
jgi:hypothetical protein